MSKKRIATVWLDGCSGCHMSFLDMDERLLEVAAAADLVYMDALLPDPLPALTPHTITDRAALHAELAQIRARGYAVDREENTEGIVCVARTVPVRTPAADAISLSIPRTRVAASTIDEVARALADAVAKAAAARRFL